MPCTNRLTRALAPLFAVGILVPNASRAQAPTPRAADTSSASPDSLATRLKRAEAAIALLKQQLATEASSAVKTRSRLQLELAGRVQTNAFYATARMNNNEVPLFVRETDGAATGGRGTPGARLFGASIRQTTLGVAVSVDSVLGGTFLGDADLDFFDATTAFRARLRTARAQLVWPRTELLVGADGPLIADVDPKSLATVGIPGFATAGNLWSWLPQVRLSRDVARSSIGATMLRWGVQVAALGATTGEVHAAELDGVDAGDRAGRPAVQARARVRWGRDDASDDARGDIGIGVHRGWSRSAGDSLSTNGALAVSMHVGVGHGVSVRGEVYRGRAVRGLGGAAIGQNFGIANAGQSIGAPLRNTAGWAQVIAEVRPTVTAAVGCGADAVNVADRPERQRNVSCAANVAWRPTQPMVLAAEYRTFATRYASGTRRAAQLNLVAAFEW